MEAAEFVTANQPKSKQNFQTFKIYTIMTKFEVIEIETENGTWRKVEIETRTTTAGLTSLTRTVGAHWGDTGSPLTDDEWEQHVEQNAAISINIY